MTIYCPSFRLHDSEGWERTQAALMILLASLLPQRVECRRYANGSSGWNADIGLSWEHHVRVGKYLGLIK